MARASRRAGGLAGECGQRPRRAVRQGLPGAAVVLAALFAAVTVAATPPADAAEQRPALVGARSVARTIPAGVFPSAGTQRRRGLTPLFQSFSLSGKPANVLPRTKPAVRPAAPAIARPALSRAVVPAIARPALSRAVALAAATAGSSQRKAGGGRYRTMCVRLCDGYYFPISFRTSRQAFEADEKACAASCSAPARLFHYVNPGETPEAMRDRDGNAYRDLDNAFLYRRRYVADCRCQPEPWTDEARRRQAEFAAAAARDAANAAVSDVPLAPAVGDAPLAEPDTDTPGADVGSHLASSAGQEATTR